MSNLINEDKYRKIKRKLKETTEINDSLSKSFIRAKKKIRILTFERNLLLDCISRLNPHKNDQSSQSDEDSSIEDSESEIEENTITKSTSINNNKLQKRITSSPVIDQQQQQQLHQQKTITVASAPPKRSRINRVNIKTRRVQPIERNSNGDPVLPQQIGVLTVLNLGKIITDRDAFHNERYIFPVGYTVRRTYPSMINPSSNTIITSTIIDGGDGPRFRVVASDQQDQPIIANSATGAWTVVVKKSNEIRQREHSNSASGPDYYGFKHPTIAKMIQDLPGTKNLKNYIWQHFEEMEPRAAKGVMAAAEKKRDNLEQMGNANRKTVSPKASIVPSSFNESIELKESSYLMDTDEEVDELGISDNDP